MGRLEVKSSILLCWALMLMYSAAEREYFIQPKNVTWIDARNYCQACFKELVTLTPDNIQDIARNIGSDHWIGLRKNFNFNKNSINNLTSTPATYTVNSFTTNYINFTSNDTSSPILNWTQWANGDPLAFQNWYPGWPLPKPQPKPPKKTLCCSCSCTCPVRTTTPATTPNTTKITANVTNTATSFTDLIENTEITPQSSFSSFTDQTMTTQSTSPSFTTSVPWTTTEMPVQAQCQRSPIVEPEEPKDVDSNDVNYIEDSCVAMLSFGPWIEKNCLDLLPFICYEDRFYGQVNVTNITFKSVHLIWSAAPGNISVYRVEFTEFINKVKTNYWVVSVTDLTYELTNLTAGTNYYVQVFPVKCGRDINPENTSFYTKPNKVTNLTITTVKVRSISLSWNKPGGNVDFYNLIYESILPNGTVKTTMTNVATNSKEVEGLTPGTLYNFTIISGVNDKSAWSEQVSVSDYTNPDKVYNLNVSDNTHNSLMVTWDQPEGNFTDYIVRVTHSHNVTSFIYPANDIKSVTVTELPPGAAICINVTVRLNETVTRLGETQNICGYTTPGLISNLTLVPSEDSLDATWKHPNSSYTSFNVTLYLNETFVQTKKDINDTKVSFNDLRNAAYYIVEVRTVSGNLIGAPVKASIFTLPSPPCNVKAPHIGSDSITFLWDPPKNTEAPTYTVKLNSSFWGQIWSYATRERNYTFSDLKSGTNYFFEVRTVADGKQSNAVRYETCTVPNKREISLSMLCTSGTPLLCDSGTTRENVFQQLKTYFGQLNGSIFWELEKTSK